MLRYPSEGESMNAPGSCVDCGEEAYIQLAGEESMICAHCFAARAHAAHAKAAPALQRESGTAATREAAPARRRAAG